MDEIIRINKLYRLKTLKKYVKRIENHFSINLDKYNSFYFDILGIIIYFDNHNYEKMINLLKNIKNRRDFKILVNYFKNLSKNESFNFKGINYKIVQQKIIIDTKDLELR